MLKNYFKIAVRNILRNRLSSIINILGLAMGISACLLIYMFVQHELSYDKHHEKSDRLYRISSDLNLEGQYEKLALTSLNFAPVLQADYPEVEMVTRLMPIGRQTYWINDKVYADESVYFTDSTYFKMFDYKFLAGDANSALNKPRSIVLTEDMAVKLFGSAQQAIGKALKFTKNSHTVTAVVRPEGNTHIDANGWLSINTLDSNVVKSLQADWFRLSTFSYVLFKNKKDVEGFDQKLSSFVDAHVVPWLKSINANSSMKYRMMALPQIHLSTELQFDFPQNTSKQYVYIFAIVGLFILLIASINYMNISTAHASARAREVGVRKVLGATKRQLFWQFIGESLLLVFVSLLLALVVTELLLPFFNQITEKHFTLSFTENFSFIIILLLIMAFVGFAGGSYPALLLSSFQPVKVLKPGRAKGGGSALLRKFLVVTQFAVSVVLIIGTLVVFSQITFMKNKNLGFSKENLVSITLPQDTAIARKVPALKEELLRNPAITSVAATGTIPGEKGGRLLFFVDRDGKNEEKGLNIMFADPDFLQLLKVDLSKGRYFSKKHPTDLRNSLIINESAVHFLGLKEPLGQQLSSGLMENGKVIGVVKDFHYTSLHNPIEPLVILPYHGNSGRLVARIRTEDIPATLSYIEKTYKSFAPRHPLEYFFVDQNFEKAYKKEEKMLTIFGYFAGLTIFIACLGLFGLASYTTTQRTKEIGIRKVNGASTRDISMLFVKDFVKLVAIALVLAWPLAYYLMHRWLEDFAYRVPLSVSSFALAGILAMLIALLTVSFHAIKAALADPVKALRYE